MNDSKDKKPHTSTLGFPIENENSSSNDARRNDLVLNGIN